MPTGDQYLAIVTKRFGRVKGEATSKGVEDQLEVIDFKFVADSPSHHESGDGGEGTSVVAEGKPHFHAVKFTVEVNTATPRLFDAFINNDLITMATLTCRKAGGGNAGALRIYYQIRFSNARLTHYEFTATNAAAPNLQIEMDYEKIEMVYHQQKGDGSLDPNGIKGAWSLSENAVPDNTLPDPKGWGNSK